MVQPIGSISCDPHPSDTRHWWESRRWRYNLWLALAGVGAFSLYCLVCWTLLPRVVPAMDIEITLFTILFQGSGYLIAMGLANICYFLGPLLEYLCKPQDPLRFRSTCYFLGTGFSVSLPFCIPAYLAWWSITGTQL